MYCIVSPFKNTFDEKWLLYFIPDFLKNEISIWMIISIPLKNQIEIAVVIGISKDPLNLDFDKEKIKSIIEVKNDFVFLEDYQIELIKFISEYYFTPIHNSIRLFFPRNLREKIEKEKLDFLTTEIQDINYNYNFNKKLTSSQEKSYKQISKSKNNKILFHWITWSWKTEIYIKLIKDYLEKWKQSLLLIPEIILSTQIWEKIKRVFWDDVIIISSNITEATKTKYWKKIKYWEAKIILWTRSALFFPYKDLWLIIVDEEHDNSYVSDSAPRYNWIEIVNKISDILNIKLILGSWTPSINTMYRAIKWKYEIVNLFEKYKS